MTHQRLYAYTNSVLYILSRACFVAFQRITPTLVYINYVDDDVARARHGFMRSKNTTAGAAPLRTMRSTFVIASSTSYVAMSDRIGSCIQKKPSSLKPTPTDRPGARPFDIHIRSRCRMAHFTSPSLPKPTDNRSLESVNNNGPRSIYQESIS